jgi:hypothetical protein
MKFPGLLKAAVCGILFSNLLAQADPNVAPVASKTAKPLTKCPKHYTKHKDDLGAVWCMDSSGRNYTPENARLVAKSTDKKAGVAR